MKIENTIQKTNDSNSVIIQNKIDFRNSEWYD